MARAKIVLISGKQGSGKSTLQGALERQAKLSKTFNHVAVINFADSIYEIHDDINKFMKRWGFEPPKKDGTLLQLLGTDWGRKTYGENVWVDVLKNRVEHLKRLYGSVLFIIADCRFKNELLAFPEAIKVRLEASESLRKGRAQSWRENTNHPSEVDLDDMPQGAFDFYFSTGGNPLGNFSTASMVEILMKEINK